VVYATNADTGQVATRLDASATPVDRHHRRRNGANGIADQPTAPRIYVAKHQRQHHLVINAVDARDHHHDRRRRDTPIAVVARSDKGSCT
jgi:hypothetical protein